MQDQDQHVHEHWLDSSTLGVDHLLDCGDIVNFLNEQTCRQHNHHLVPTEGVQNSERSRQSVDNHFLNSDNDIIIPPPTIGNSVEDVDEFCIDETDNSSFHDSDIHSLDITVKGNMKLDNFEQDRRTNSEDAILTQDVYSAFCGLGSVDGIIDNDSESQSNCLNSNCVDRDKRGFNQVNSHHDSSLPTEDVEPKLIIDFGNGSKECKGTHQRFSSETEKCHSEVTYSPFSCPSTSMYANKRRANTTLCSQKDNYGTNHLEFPTSSSTQTEFSANQSLPDFEGNDANSFMMDFFPQPSSSVIPFERFNEILPRQRSTHQSLPDKGTFDQYNDMSAQPSFLDINGNFNASENNLPFFQSYVDTSQDFRNIDAQRIPHQIDSSPLPALPVSAEYSQTTHNVFPCPSTAGIFVCESNNTSMVSTRDAPHILQSKGQNTLGSNFLNNDNSILQNDRSNANDTMESEKRQLFISELGELPQTAVPPATPDVTVSTTSGNSVFGGQDYVCTENISSLTNVFHSEQLLRQHPIATRIDGNQTQSKLADGLIFQRNDSSRFDTKTTEKKFELELMNSGMENYPVGSQPDSSGQIITRALEQNVTSLNGHLTNQQSHMFLQQDSSKFTMPDKMHGDSSLYDSFSAAIGSDGEASFHNSKTSHVPNRPGFFGPDSFTNGIIPKDNKINEETHLQRLKDDEECGAGDNGVYCSSYKNHRCKNNIKTGDCRTVADGRGAKETSNDGGFATPLQVYPEMATNVSVPVGLKEQLKQKYTPIKNEMELDDNMDEGLKEAFQQATRTGKLTPMIKQELKRKIFYNRCMQGKGEIKVDPTPKPVFELTDEEKERKRKTRERNRLAASRCRKRKKVKGEQIGQVLEEEEMVNTKLRKRIQGLIEIKEKAIVKLIQKGIPRSTLQKCLSACTPCSK